MTASLQQLTCLTSARFRARAPGPVSGQLCSAPGGRTGHDSAGFLLPFGRRHPLLEASCPARGLCPSRDRPTAPPAGGADPSGVSMFRTHETRLGPGALCTPGTTAPTRPGTIPSRRLPPPSGRSLSPRHHDPSRDVQLTRHLQEFTGVHPRPAFPSPVTPGRIGDPWAFHRVTPGALLHQGSPQTRACTFRCTRVKQAARAIRIAPEPP